MIIYAVDEKTRYLLRRNESITVINERVTGVHRSTALSAKIIGAEVGTVIGLVGYMARVVSSLL